MGVDILARRCTTPEMSFEQTIKRTGNKVKNLSTINYTFFLKMLKEGWFFILASFFSAFVPFCICLIASAIKDKGAEVVLGIGLLTSFQVIFCGVGFAMAMAMVFAIIKLTQTRSKDNGFINEAGLVVSQFAINILIGTIMTGISIGVSIGFAAYNCGRPNMTLVKQEAFNYIFVTSPLIILNSWFAVQQLVIFKNKGNRMAFFVTFMQNAVTISLVCAFAFGTDMQSIGIGLGYDLGMVFGIILSFIIMMTGDNRYKIRELRMKWSDYVFLIKSTYKVGIVSAWRVSIRGFIVVILSIISTRIYNVISLNLVYAKVLWFNMNFLLPWFATGISNALKYSTVKNPREYDFNDIKPFIGFISLTIFLNIISSAIWFACFPEIINQYISNMESMRYFALDHLYVPANLSSTGQTLNPDFFYSYNMWDSGNNVLPAPEWVNEAPYSNYIAEHLSQEEQMHLGQLYWVNVSVYGSYQTGQAAIFPMFWGWNTWTGNPNIHPEFFCTTILFVILYHLLMTLDSFTAQINSLYTKKSYSFLTSIVLHTSIMTFVLVFGYFEVPNIGIEAFVLPFCIFTMVTAARSVYIFTKTCNQYRLKYYSEHLETKPAAWFVNWQKFKQTKFVKVWRKIISPIKFVQNESTKLVKFVVKKVLTWEWFLKLFNIKPIQKKTNQIEKNVILDTKELVQKMKTPKIVYQSDVNKQDETMNDSDKQKYSTVVSTKNKFNEYYASLSPHDDHSHRYKKHRVSVINEIREQPQLNNLVTQQPTDVPEIELQPDQTIHCYDDTYMKCACENHEKLKNLNQQ